MITYLGMTAPIALAAEISWFRHPYKEGENEVKVAHVGTKKWAAPGRDWPEAVDLRV